ncbi:MAG: ribokinase [Pseudomonadota bacterium]
MSKVVVVGSINVDLCCYLDRWPEVHETVHTAGFKQFLGGKGANQAVAAARLGADVTFVGAVGRAAYADFVEETLAAEALALNLVDFHDAPTGMAFIDIGPRSENIIRLVGGANAALSPADISDRAEVFQPGGLLLLQNEIPLEVSLEAAEHARAQGMTVVMDPAPSPAQPWPVETARAFDVLTPNAVEASLYCGFVPSGAEEGRNAAQRITERFGCDAIVTMGADGVAWSAQGDTGWISVPEVATVDTVGAGDCFNGAFATAVAEGKAWREAMAFAVEAASLSTTRQGAMAALPRREDLAPRESN